MSDVALLFVAVAVPWALGSMLVCRVHPAERSGDAALVLGTGWLIGVVTITLLLRALGAGGLAIDRIMVVSVAAVIVVGAVAMAYRAPDVLTWLRRAGTTLMAGSSTTWARVAWFVLLAALALRLVLVCSELLLRPLFPWEAWTRFAPYAKVLVGINALPRFVDGTEWLRAAGNAWFDGEPRTSATIGLLQAWTTLFLGRFDDAGMNLPWCATLAALGLVGYGALRASGATPLAALAFGTLLVSIPLVDVHAALAGYPDLFIATIFGAGVSLLQPPRIRPARGRLILLVALTAALPYFHQPAWPLAFALLAGMATAVAGRYSRAALTVAAAGSLVLLFILARSTIEIGGRALHIDYRPAFGSLMDNLFLFGSWNVLWYAIVAILIAARHVAASPAWRPPVVTLAVAAAWVAVLTAFPAARELFGGVVTVERLLLMVAPSFAIVAGGLLVTWLREGPAPETPAAVVA